jgi:hypothetical protein
MFLNVSTNSVIPATNELFVFGLAMTVVYKMFILDAKVKIIIYHKTFCNDKNY